MALAGLWYDSVDTLLAAALTPEGAAAAATLRADESMFIDLPRSPIFLAEEHQIL